MLLVCSLSVLNIFLLLFQHLLFTTFFFSTFSIVPSSTTTVSLTYRGKAMQTPARGGKGWPACRNLRKSPDLTSRPLSYLSISYLCPHRLSHLLSLRNLLSLCYLISHLLSRLSSPIPTQLSASPSSAPYKRNLIWREHAFGGPPFYTI